MKAHIDAKGVMNIWPSNATEEYALKRWVDDQTNVYHVHVGQMEYDSLDGEIVGGNVAAHPTVVVYNNGARE